MLPNSTKYHPTDPFLAVKSSPTLYINERSKALEKEGKEVYKIGFGQSPFPVPCNVVEALKQNAHVKDYLPVQGLISLREVIADYYHQSRNWSISADDVVIGPGSKELIFLCQLVLKYDLILPNPSWVSYAPQAKLVNSRTHWVETRASNNYKLEPEALEEVCTKVPQSKLLILNSPNNPTGHSYSESELKDLAEIAEKHKVLVISDEIYSRLQFNKSYISIAEFYPHRTLITSGLSKWCGAGGWRLGTMVIPKEQLEFKQRVLAAASETFSCVSAPIQYAAMEAYKGGAIISDFLHKSRYALRIVSNYVSSRLNEAGIKCSIPQGGFYTFISFKEFNNQLKAKGIYDDETLCNKLLNETGVALLPGNVFGRAKEEYCARLAYVDFNGEKIISYKAEELVKYENIIPDLFPKIKLATQLLIDFVKQL